jgi:hypothetical protein
MDAVHLRIRDLGDQPERPLARLGEQRADRFPG